MKMTDLFLGELEREAAVTRRALERVPEGRYDWKPHPKSMALGTLAQLCASMPSWIPMIIDQDELDIAPANGKKYEQTKLSTRKELVEAHDKNVAGARSTRTSGTSCCGTASSITWRTIAASSPYISGSTTRPCRRFTGLRRMRG